MNGRCETDPFDQAVNVCPSCYGEFCPQCLVKTRGRKHPLCRECAIVASGVRSGAKPVPRGDRKTAKKRRTALQKAPVAESFRYFDAEPVTADSSPTSTSDQLLAAAERELGDPTASQIPQQPEPAEFDSPEAESVEAGNQQKTSAIDQLGAIRETGAVQPAASPGSSDETFVAAEVAGEFQPDPAQAPVAPPVGAGPDDEHGFRKPRPFIGSGPAAGESSTEAGSGDAPSAGSTPVAPGSATDGYEGFQLAALQRLNEVPSALPSRRAQAQAGAAGAGSSLAEVSGGIEQSGPTSPPQPPPPTAATFESSPFDPTAVDPLMPQSLDGSLTDPFASATGSEPTGQAHSFEPFEPFEPFGSTAPVDPPPSFDPSNFPGDLHPDDADTPLQPAETPDSAEPSSASLARLQGIADTGATEPSFAETSSLADPFGGASSGGALSGGALSGDSRSGGTPIPAALAGPAPTPLPPEPGPELAAPAALDASPSPAGPDALSGRSTASRPGDATMPSPFDAPFTQSDGPFADSAPATAFAAATAPSAPIPAALAGPRPATPTDEFGAGRKSTDPVPQSLSTPGDLSDNRAAASSTDFGAAPPALGGPDTSTPPPPPPAASAPTAPQGHPEAAAMAAPPTLAGTDAATPAQTAPATPSALSDPTTPAPAQTAPVAPPALSGPAATVAPSPSPSAESSSVSAPGSSALATPSALTGPATNASARPPEAPRATTALPEPPPALAGPLSRDRAEDVSQTHTGPAPAATPAPALQPAEVPASFASPVNDPVPAPASAPGTDRAIPPALSGKPVRDPAPLPASAPPQTAPASLDPNLHVAGPSPTAATAGATSGPPATATSTATSTSTPSSHDHGGADEGTGVPPLSPPLPPRAEVREPPAWTQRSLVRRTDR